MGAAGVSSEVRGFRFRKLDKPEEFRQVLEVNRAVWGDEGVPTTLQRAFQDNGGLVLGAFADIYLAGFAVSLIGWDGTSLYHYSHATAVRPEYQNHQLGFRLKAFQRDEVLKLGLSEIRWTFDPLQSRNAWLNVRRLGGRPDRYYIHYYGQMADTINRDMETDRVRLRWEIASPHVEERVGGKAPTADEDRTRWTRSTAIVETEVGEKGLRRPTVVAEPSGAPAHLEIPFDIAAVREHEPSALRPWRHAVRDGFRAAFDMEYRVDDFAIVTADHERRSFYFLSPAPKEAAADGAPPSPSV
ncbi:MAG TPA: GNAT family N-acetyltransferase [Thermoplasmata archaeon]|nr:GNAT family N-acetyltransferase [Thermoplasmata archaeon]